MALLRQNILQTPRRGTSYRSKKTSREQDSSMQASTLKLTILGIFVVIFALGVLPSEEVPLQRFRSIESENNRNPFELISGCKRNIAHVRTTPSAATTTSTWMWLDAKDIALGKAHMKKKFPNVDWDKEWEKLIT